VGPGFGKDHAGNKEMERGDDSKKSHPALGRAPRARPDLTFHPSQEVPMGRGILLWLLGIPLPIILLLAFLR
jgi:hypothetical protein